jgi:signal transduction histidine kinase
MRGLLENLLSSAAIREGRLRVHLRPLDIVETVNEIVALVGPLFEHKRQTIRVTAPAHPMVEADAHRLSQVLLNLLSNANKYAHAGSEIEVAVSTTAGGVHVSVSDRGPGLPVDQLQGAFRAYDRAGRAGGDGLGIGLWVVRSIVRAHGGHVGALNREGGGATFWFELRPTVGKRIVASPSMSDLVAAATEGMSAV